MEHAATVANPHAHRASVGALVFRLLLWGELFVLVLLIGNNILRRSTGWGAETLVAMMSEWTLGLMQVPVVRSNVHLETVSGSVEIVAECTGLTALTLIGTFICAFPAGWRTRLWGVSLAALGILLGNTLRVVALVWLMGVSRSAFEAAHEFGWPLFLIAGAIVYFYFWTGYARRTVATRE